MNSSVVAPRRLVLDFISSHSHRFLSLQKMSQEQGSWIPIIVIGILFLLRWIFYDQGSTAISIRKWWNYRKIQLRNKLGYRDDTKYQMNVGAGASNNYKRQG